MQSNLISKTARVLTATLLFALLASPVAADGATAKATTKRRATVRRSAAWVVATMSPASSEPEQANAMLQTYINKYPILAGTTVRIEDTAAAYQAVTFVGSAQIVINSHHTASLSQILGHEIWHVIDWRDNGRIDWGERVPPAGY